MTLYVDGVLRELLVTVINLHYMYGSDVVLFVRYLFTCCFPMQAACFCLCVQVAYRLCEDVVDMGRSSKMATN